MKKALLALPALTLLLTMGVAEASGPIAFGRGDRMRSEIEPRKFPGAVDRDGRGGLTRLDEARTPLFIPREVIVQYSEGTSPLARAAIGADLGARSARGLPVPGLEVIHLDRGSTVLEALEELESNPLVEFAEPNYVYSLQATTPNDTKFQQLWGLDNTGQTIEGTTGTADADIDAPEAWDVSTGSDAVKVAVVDSGVAAGHPDLSPNLGAGWDFIQNDSTPQDKNGHGTHVAGTIGAKGNDGFGVVGVNWDVTILPIRVFGASPQTSTDLIVSGMQFAVDAGAHVVNMSLGGPGFSQAMADVISSAPDILWVTAAGNGGDDRVGDDNETSPEFPCNYTFSNVMCVAATDQTDQLTDFSNFGTTSVDLAAPGFDILSAAPAFTTAFSDGFETAPIPWTTGGTSNWGLESDSLGNYATDSPLGAYQNNANSFLDSTSFSLVGKAGCDLDYWLYLDVETSQDALFVEATTDGTNFQTLDGWTGWSETWVPLNADLSAYDGQAQVAVSFRLVSNGSVVADGAAVDDVSIECDDSTFGNDDVAFLAGTSMATPHVAGAAALLKAAEPAATTAEIKAAILDGVDPNASLTGKVLSGGRLNLFAALEQLLDPSPTPTPTPTSTVTSPPGPGPGPGPGPAPSPTPTPSPTPSPTPTPTPSAVPSPTPTPSPSPSAPPDTIAPAITDVSDLPDPFSPNGDGRRDKVKISWSLNESASVRVTIRKPNGKLVKDFGTAPIAVGEWFVRWGGRADSGRLVGSGRYAYKIVAIDAAGNRSVEKGITTVRR